MSNEAPKFNRRKFLLNSLGVGLTIMNGVGYNHEYQEVKANQSSAHNSEGWYHLGNQIIYAIGILASIGALTKINKNG